MHHVVGFLRRPVFQQPFLVATLLALSSLAWGEGSLPAITSADEPREVPGYIIAAIIFNLTLVTVFLVLLRREWKKHKVVPRPTLNDEHEGK